MNIPARYTTGYLGDIGVPPVPEPMDFSAWFEVFLGDRWYTFDARHNQRRIGRIVMARGRDAGDVPITMCFGPNTPAPLRRRHRRGRREPGRGLTGRAYGARIPTTAKETSRWPRHRSKDQVQGEGDYEAGRRYDKAAASSPSRARSSRRRATRRRTRPRRPRRCSGRGGRQVALEGRRPLVSDKRSRADPRARARRAREPLRRRLSGARRGALATRRRRRRRRHLRTGVAAGMSPLVRDQRGAVARRSPSPSSRAPGSTKGTIAASG